MTTLDMTNTAVTRSRFLHSLTAPFLPMVEAWMLARRRDGMRRELESLSDRALSDIGLARGDIDTLVERSYRR